MTVEGRLRGLFPSVTSYLTTSRERSSLFYHKLSSLARHCSQLVLSSPRISCPVHRQTTTSHDSEVRIRIIEDTCPPPPRNLPQHMKKRPLKAVAGGEKCFYICRELQVGPAVGSGEEMGMTLRRPIRGILGTLALNRRQCRGATAIEPEIALLMANLAKVSTSTSVCYSSSSAEYFCSRAIVRKGKSTRTGQYRPEAF